MRNSPTTQELLVKIKLEEQKRRNRQRLSENIVFATVIFILTVFATTGLVALLSFQG